MTSRPRCSARAALATAVLFANVALVSSCTSEPTLPEGVAPDSVEAALLREFHGSYAEDAPSPVATREYELVAAPSVTKIVGDETLNVWSYNGTVPGPTLRVRLGERIKVKLVNRLPQPTTIHWHGMRVPNAMDGVPGVTQAPVEPGGEFLYDFVPKDAGTFWFHPHVRGSEQIERGLYGILVVEDPEPLPYSREVVWVLDDWKLGQDGQIVPQFVTRHDLAHDGRWGNVATVNGRTDTVLEVSPGERIRLRMAVSANGRIFQPDFGDLEPTVIAVDGMYTARPLSIEGYKLAPGNRLDVDIVIPSDAGGSEFVVSDRFTRRPYQLARIVVRDTDPVDTPAFDPPSNPRVPGWERGLAEEPDKVYRLNARQGGKYGIEWTINDEVWGAHSITQLPAGRWTKIRFVNESYRLHPMHIHGQFFKVLARNDEPVDEPHFRDTVLLERKDTVDVAMVPLDWGKWLMHCHILEHAEAGMRTLLEVSEP